jgi:hypothetical protein
MWMNTSRQRALLVAAAYGMWSLMFVGVCLFVLTGWLKAVPYHAYIDAGQRWLERAPLYDLSNIDGFQYLPQSAAFFAQLSRLGSPYADVLWRALSLFAFVSAERRVARLLLPGQSALGFLVVTCLSIAPAANALGNGQANLALAALSLHAAAALALRRYWLLSALIGFGLALKPLLVVPLLVVVALYPQTRWRTLLWLALLALWPFVSAGPDYAIAQYIECARKLRACAQPDRLFEDLRSLLWVVHVRPPERILFAVRAAFALLVLALCALLRQRLREPLASCHVLAVSVSYLMLFNPRTLSTSYVMVAGFSALLAAAHWLHGRQLTAAAFAACTLAWNLSHHVLPWIEHWSHALACCAFFLLLAREAFRGPQPWSGRTIDAVRVRAARTG